MTHLGASVMQAGLRGLANHMQQRVSREMGLLHLAPTPRAAFWLAICKKLEVAAREMIQARIEVDEAGGRSDAAIARFAQTVTIEVQGLGILDQQEVRLNGMIYSVARAGLAALIPAVVEHIDANKQKEA